MKVRFCERNKGKGKVIRRLAEEFPDVDVKVKDCIKECSSCSEMPVAKVNKAKIAAKDGETLYRKIQEVIQSKQKT